jgi:hypothetical protein
VLSILSSRNPDADEFKHLERLIAEARRRKHGRAKED